MKFTKAFGVSVVVGMLLAIVYAGSVTEKATAEIREELKVIEAKANYTPQKLEVVVVEPEPVVIEETVEEIKPLFESISLRPELQLYLWEQCQARDIDFYLALALMKSESNFKEDAEGDSGRFVGLMQINKCWWDVMDDAGVDVFKPMGNIDAGLLILQDYKARGFNDVEMIQLYKCGEGRGKQLLNDGIIISQADNVVREAREMEGALKNEY